MRSDHLFADPAQTAAWAQLLLAWAVATYGLPVLSADPMDDLSGDLPGRRRWMARVAGRAGLLALVPLIAFPLGWGAVLAAAVLGGCGVALPFARAEALRRSSALLLFRAELEMLGNALPAMLLAAVVRGAHLVVLHGVSLPLSDRKLAALALSASIALAAIGGGTFFVRGVLAKTGTHPRPQEADNEKELNVGRLIGNLERAAIVAAVAVGSYEAVGFLVAAKGVVRLDDFKQRPFAEYFLLGTLASVLVAMVSGLAIRLVFASLW